jgi:signal transduction histidine kinase
MLADKLSAYNFGAVFPHMENILHCGFYLYSFENQSTYWSPGMYNLLGLDSYSVDSTFDNFLKYILPEDRPRVMNAVTRARQQGVSYDLDFSVLDARGIYRRLHASTEMRYDEGGNLKEYGGVMQDITENYFYKKALEQKVAQLDKSNRNLQEFVYVASHDLQEPLRKISTFSERLKSRFDAALGEEGKMYLGRILNSSTNMQALLEDLLSFSRLASSGKEYEAVSLQDTLHSALADLEIKIEETQAVVNSVPLPVVQGYPSQLKQLFINLLGNAIKFRKPGVPPLISISCADAHPGDYPGNGMQRELKYIAIQLQDNGIGFEEEFAERIFQIFQRLNGKAEYPGSGVGLAICKRIAENHRGAIFARGTPGEGARFTVLLPLKQA